MKVYRYTAIDHQGNQQQGSLQADDKKRAALQLRHQGFYVLELNDNDTGSVQPAVPAKETIGYVLSQCMPISMTQKVFFFRQLSLTLRSGLSITQALRITHNLVRGRLKSIVADINQRVQSGNSLSAAIAAQGRLFPDMAQYMIQSAEATGELDQVIERIAVHMERRADIKRQMMTTMLYPLITLLIAILMFFFLVSSAIPKFAQFFEKTGKRLPPEAQSLIDFSHFLNQWGVYITMATAIAIFATLFLHKTDKGGRVIDNLLLHIPIIGSVIRTGAMSQIGWGFSMLLKSGLTLIEAMDIIKNLMGNRIIANAIFQARENVIQGQDLGSSLHHGSIDILIQQLAAVGEKSGSLDVIMDEAGSYYENMLKIKSKVLSSMIEPIAILFIGGIVGYVYYVFFKTLFAVSGG